MFKKIKNFLDKLPQKETDELATESLDESANQASKPQTTQKSKKKPLLAKPEDSESLMPELDSPIEKEKVKFNVSLRDLKVISTALMHYHKYLQSKGQTAQAEEVAEVDKKFYEFISSRGGQK
jgi:hypothetical protein